MSSAKSHLVGQPIDGSEKDGLEMVASELGQRVSAIGKPVQEDSTRFALVEQDPIRCVLRSSLPEKVLDVKSLLQKNFEKHDKGLERAQRTLLQSLDEEQTWNN
jgi:hypothetical protein